MIFQEKIEMQRVFAKIIALFTVFTLTGCAPFQPKEDADIVLLENQIADATQKIEEIHQRVSLIQARLDRHERTIADFEKIAELERSHGKPSRGLAAHAETEVTVTEPQPPEKRPSSPARTEKRPSPSLPAADKLYHMALSAYKGKYYQRAISLFDLFADNYPAHDLADNALYWKGECLYAQKDFAGAILVLNEVVSKYPDGGKVPDALLKIGYAHLELEDPTEARLFLKKVVKNYPFSPTAGKAEKKLKGLKIKQKEHD